MAEEGKVVPSRKQLGPPNTGCTHCHTSRETFLKRHEQIRRRHSHWSGPEVLKRSVPLAVPGMLLSSFFSLSFSFSSGFWAFSFFCDASAVRRPIRSDSVRFDSEAMRSGAGSLRDASRRVSHRAETATHGTAEDPAFWPLALRLASRLCIRSQVWQVWKYQSASSFALSR